MKTSLALLSFVLFLMGFGLATFLMAFKEATRSFQFWRHKRADARKEKVISLLHEGRSRLVGGKHREARKVLGKAVKKANGEKAVAIEMARAEIADGHPSSAESRLKRVLSEHPECPEALALLHESYRAKNDVDGQLAALSRWLRVAPEHLPSLIQLRDLHRQTSNWPEAVRVQEKILAGTAGKTERETARRELSELCLLKAGTVSPAQALPELEKLTVEDSEFAPGWAALGDALAAINDREGSFQAWLRGYNSSGQPGLLLKAEAVRIAEGKPEPMLKLYQKLGKKQLAPRLLRARLLLSLDRNEEALDVLESEKAGYPISNINLLLSGEALFRLGSHDEAVKKFRAAEFGNAEDPFISFICKKCLKSSRSWRYICANCGAVGTVDMDFFEVANIGREQPQAALGGI